jgi:hypothetical protein
VQELAYNKHGGPEGLEIARDATLRRRTENRLKKKRLQEDLVCPALV